MGVDALMKALSNLSVRRVIAELQVFAKALAYRKNLPSRCSQALGAFFSLPFKGCQDAANGIECRHN
ncbi:hypothetical protein AA105894_1897 [Asaia spathodeae NBRC 105894]|nr:hypothetical protein AA105894_1897 [Asaia spathodeae NBRC 105894]